MNYSSQDKVGAAVQGELFKRKRQELPDAERVQLLQTKLYQKAKQERGYKFYVLYDKMFIPYILREAWKSVKANGGTAGVDRKTIEEVEQGGIGLFLNELGEDLRKQEYKPQAVRRVMIPKANGGERPLGIPTVRDRVAQTVCKLILEPIFEADFEDSSYGFRPQKDASGAIDAIKDNLKRGYTEVYDADLSRYFDTIPHDKLQIALKERIADPRVLKLINKWLKAPVNEDGKLTGGKGNRIGTPQGGVISPLLANIYLHLLDRIVNNPKSLFAKEGIKIVRYADDFVLMGRKLSGQVIEKLRSLLDRMGLKINEAKTRLIDARQEGFNFLGFTIRYDYDLHGRDKRYWNIYPGKLPEQKVRDKIKDYLHSHGHSRASELSSGLNAILRGWLNYYTSPNACYPANCKRRLRFYLYTSINRYFARKSQRKCRLYGHNAFEGLVVRYQLIDPTKYKCR